MAAGSKQQTIPGWKRLWRHSYRLAAAWLLRTAPRGFSPGRKAGFQRLLVPLDPWRYYELGTLADQSFSGRCLDISSPKVLPSLLQREGSGDWLGIDLFEDEITAWKAIDPNLQLEVQDATALPYDEGSFDNVICISVIEHMGRGNDSTALAEMLRIVRPGGTLHLTSMVASESRDVYVDDKLYGNASVEGDDGRVFFEHVYSPQEFSQMTEAAGWETLDCEYAIQTQPRIEDRFYKWAPASYLIGGLLRFWFPRTIDVTQDPSAIGQLPAERSAVVYARLQKPQR